MALLPDLAFINKARKQLTDHGLVKIQAKSDEKGDSVLETIGSYTIC